MIYNGTLNDFGTLCNSCTIYIVLLIIIFLIITGIGSVCTHFYWYSKRCNTGVNTSANTEAVIY